MSTLELKAGGRLEFGGLRGRTVFLYIVRGEVGVQGRNIGAFRLVELGEGDVLVIEGSMDVCVIFGHADPIDEPVVSHGPFVMNSEDEIRQAYADFREGRFGK
jgi:redox-sensitive bicupin YhaK (pirin superfamily)